MKGLVFNSWPRAKELYGCENFHKNESHKYGDYIKTLGAVLETNPIQTQVKNILRQLKIKEKNESLWFCPTATLLKWKRTNI